MDRPAKDKVTLCRQSIAVAALDVVVCQVGVGPREQISSKALECRRNFGVVS